MPSIYIWQLVWTVAAPLVMCMHCYIRGVAIMRIYPYLEIVIELLFTSPRKRPVTVTLNIHVEKGPVLPRSTKTINYVATGQNP